MFAIPVRSDEIFEIPVVFSARSTNLGSPWHSRMLGLEHDCIILSMSRNVRAWNLGVRNGDNDIWQFPGSQPIYLKVEHTVETMEYITTPALIEYKTRRGFESARFTCTIQVEMKSLVFVVQIKTSITCSSFTQIWQCHFWTIMGLTIIDWFQLDVGRGLPPRILTSLLAYRSSTVSTRRSAQVESSSPVTLSLHDKNETSGFHCCTVLTKSNVHLL